MPLQVNGIQAWITVENKVQVQEYAPEIDQATGVATCWIGAEPGQVRYYSKHTTDAIEDASARIPTSVCSCSRGSSILLLPFLPPCFLTLSIRSALDINIDSHISRHLRSAGESQTCWIPRRGFTTGISVAL
jgi:hypothetical protein